ncbi:hypothetical protein NQ315_005974 [Exocentrus adspersus]|uniref:DUF5641 domain-containing protein n=1 Tax=Exocentrus adspersus TaxID=1586481 RepID=A0AAV8V7I2_9CUCU|nr:hypothetical protein NQ315_005974 [Exocentrus adspersus]
MPDGRENNEQELKELRLKRGFIKANITRCRTYLKLKRRLSNLNPIIHEFNAVQEKIELLTNDSETEQSERDNFESDYYGICSNIEEILERSNQGHELSSDANSSRQPAQVVQAVQQSSVSDVDIFTGDYSKWVQFRDCFQAVVGRNATLSGVQKLFHLRKSLSPEVLKNIQSLALTDANYEVAWNILVKRYEKGKRIVETHIREILDFPCLIRESASDLRNFYNTINNSLLSLRNLGKPVDQWDEILVPIIVDKLDSKTKREYEACYIEEINRTPTDISSPTVISVLSKIEHKCELLENLEKRKQEAIKPTFKTTRSDNKYSSSSNHLNTSANTISCYFCKGEHTIYKCPEFLKLSVPDRIDEIKKRKFCLNCLRPHDAPQEHCMSTKCRKCKRLHNTLLHMDKSKFGNTATREHEETQKTDTSVVRQVNSPATGTDPAPAAGGRSLALATATPADAGSDDKNVCLFTSSQVLLNTAIISVQDSEGHLHKARVLLDSGSMSNFIREEFFDNLKLEKIPINHAISGVGQVSSTIRYKSNMTISSSDNAFNTRISCLILPQITSNIPLVSFSTNNLEIPKNAQLADPDFNVSRPIDMLLGAGIFWRLIKTERISLKRTNLNLQQSKLGWLVSGEIENKIQNKSVNCLNTLGLDSQIAKFWEIEEVFTKPALSESELFCEKHFLENYRRDEDGHVVVKIPFKDNYTKLGDSRKMALNRFFKLEKRLVNNPPLYDEYVKFMDEYEAMNHMKAISLPNREELDYFIPHHPVIRESSCTTKLRVVYDASMKSTSGLSLNDVQHVGPIIIVGKILMQKLWQSNTKWDEIIPDRLKDEWLRFYKELIYLRDINIPRHVTSSDRTFVELHGFGDASEQAYGACVYLRTKLKNGHFISRLLCAKSRVAPLKKLSLPRLELSSAVLLARLTDKVKNAINIKIDQIFLWSDSTIALSWIRGSPSRWKTFVANRVGEIQRLTKIENWNHVSSRENPADLISRGTTILELKDNDFWWTGPKWLTQEHLPIFELQSISDDIPEQRSITNIAAVDDFDLFSRFSSLTRLQRVTAYCLRFIANSKIQVQEQRTTGALSVKELQNALNTLIRLAQKDSFNREYSNLLQKKGVPSKSKILSLNPFMDSENILRQFWTRWQKEYISELQVRTKWKRSDTNNDIQVGKVVLLKEEDVPPMQWPLGIIVDLHPGKDNIVRVVSVKVRGQTLKRGVNKVCVLPEEF